MPALRTSPRSRLRPRLQQGLESYFLDPIDWLSETIYSILIVLSFTLAFRVFALGSRADRVASPDYVTELLFAAIGATLAWGLIDGVMHVLLEVFQRSERHRMLQQVQEAGSQEEAIAVIAEEFDYVLEPIAGEAERQQLYQRVFEQLRTSEARPLGFKRADFEGALGCVVVAILAVLPSLVPLIVLRNSPDLAIRASNVVSFAMLFAAGYRWGKYSGSSPWKTGLLLVAVGLIMVAIAIPLGG